MNEEELELEDEEIENEELPKQGSKNQFDPEVLRSMINTGENQTGMVQVTPEDGINPETDKPLFTEVEEKNKVKPGKLKKKLGRYVESMLFDMKKNPEKYMLQTPKGMMSIEEALQQGYDPATKDFTDKGTKQEFEESLQALTPAGQEAIKRITSPGAMQMSPSQAEGMGVDAESEMVAGNQPPLGAPQEGGEAGQELSPEILAALGGGQ
jgi:hypothetical protein